MSEPKETLKELTVEETQAKITQHALAVCTAMVENAAPFPGRIYRLMLMRAFFYVLGSMPEKYWNEFKEVKPCGKEGCTCHVLCEKLVEVFSIVRSEIQKQDTLAE